MQENIENSYKVKVKVIVFDQDSVFLSDLKKTHVSKTLKFIGYSDYAKASAEIDLKDAKLVGLFCGLNNKPEEWLSLIKKAQYNSRCPKILLGDIKDFSKISPYCTLDKVGIEEVMDKPITIKEILDRVAPQVKAFEHFQKQIIGIEPEVNEGFSPVLAADYLGGSKSYFDLYVKIKEDKFLKILNALDNMDDDRLRSYLSKGLSYFYIKKTDREIYFDYCDKVLNELMKSDKISTGLKSSQALSLGEQAMNILKDGGLSEDNMLYAEKFVNSIVSLSKEMAKQKKNSLVADFLNNKELYDHGISTSLMVAVLARELGICSDKPQETIGVSVMFHDIGLLRLGEPYISTRPSDLSPEQFKLYQTHPAISIQELKHLQCCNSSMIQAIEQHHMRSRGISYPARSPGTPVHKIAEILGICDEMIELSQHSKFKNAEDLLSELEISVFPKFSLSMVRSFKKVFFSNKTIS